MSTHDHDHDHEHDGEHDDEDDGIVYLVDEDGNETEWGFLGIVADGERQYALLAPLDQLEDEESETLEIAIFRYESESEEGASFSEIEDEDEQRRAEELAAEYLRDQGHIEG